MKILMRKISIIGVSAMLLLSVAACQRLSQNLDVVGKEAVTSFDAVLKAIPDNVEADEMNAGWSLSAPMGAHDLYGVRIGVKAHFTM